MKPKIERSVSREVPLGALLGIFLTYGNVACGHSHEDYFPAKDKVSLPEAHVGSLKIDTRLLDSYQRVDEKRRSFYLEARGFLENNPKGNLSSSEVVSLAKKAELDFISEPMLGNLTSNGINVQFSTKFVFGYPVWLQSDCCGETLYALNYEHLQFLEDYVSAKIRERGIENKEEFYYRNRTLESRLPQWIKSAKNRERILKTIENLKKK